MGYGSRALEILRQYYEFKIPSLDDDQLPLEAIESIPDEDLGLLEEHLGLCKNKAAHKELIK